MTTTWCAAMARSSSARCPKAGSASRCARCGLACGGGGTNSARGEERGADGAGPRRRREEQQRVRRGADGGQQPRREAVGRVGGRGKHNLRRGPVEGLLERRRDLDVPEGKRVCPLGVECGGDLCAHPLELGGGEVDRRARHVGEEDEAVPLHLSVGGPHCLEDKAELEDAEAGVDRHEDVASAGEVVCEELAEPRLSSLARQRVCARGSDVGEEKGRARQLLECGGGEEPLFLVREAGEEEDLLERLAHAPHRAAQRPARREGSEAQPGGAARQEDGLRVLELGHAAERGVDLVEREGRARRRLLGDALVRVVERQLAEPRDGQRRIHGAGEAEPRKGVREPSSVREVAVREEDRVHPRGHPAQRLQHGHVERRLPAAVEQECEAVHLEEPGGRCAARRAAERGEVHAGADGGGCGESAAAGAGHWRRL
mmetsp:Transcript_47938/g.151932  ORF Transcript_47938/g.151932 Transcript_47938/m.151932 type:complete len:430 (-) Transcript_47938:33-1322(-)